MVHSIKSYSVEKRQQIREIKALIEEKKLDGEGFHIIALQDVAFLFYAKQTLYTIQRFKRVPKEHEIEYMNIYKIFVEMVEDCGWGFLTNDPNGMNRQYSFFAILYDTRKLNHISFEYRVRDLYNIFSKNALDCQGRSKQLSGCKAYFQDTETRKVFAVAVSCSKDQTPSQFLRNAYQIGVYKDFPTIILGDFKMPVVGAEEKTCHSLYVHPGS